MTKYLISFPSEAMVLTDEEFPIVSAAARAVIEEAKAAGVYVFGGGIHEGVDPVLVSADGAVSTEIYPGSYLKGGYTVLEAADPRGRGRVGAEDCRRLPLLTGTSGVHVRPGELAAYAFSTPTPSRISRIPPRPRRYRTNGRNVPVDR